MKICRVQTMIILLILKLWDHIVIWYYKATTGMRCWWWGIRAGKGVLLCGPVLIRTYGKGVRLGDGVRFISRPSMNVTGLTMPTIIDTRWGGIIDIGNNSGFSSVAISSKRCIRIGSRCLFGGNVRIFDHDFHSLNSCFRNTPLDVIHVRSRPITIGDDVFVGANAIILKGSRIGSRAIVAAGSVLFGLDVPEDAIVKGNPARIVSVKK